MQEKYWRYMVQIKAWIFYLDLYEESSYKWNRRINVFSAVVSSTSIAAWAIWQQFSLLWSIIIAISQVLNAIKVYWPYNIRLKLIASFMEDLKYLYNKMEYNWLKVSNGELTEEEINDLLETDSVGNVIPTEKGYRLKVVSEECPGENALPVSPTLEDVFLKYFGKTVDK